tara:strand:- start:48 stop:1544 length:1497 start_codon:yes stop_codon:yes gene_type:complete
MALFENYKEGDIYKNIPKSIQTLGKEAYGAAETATTVATSIPAQIGGIGYAMYKDATTSPDPIMLKEEKWLEKNKSKSSHPDYQRVLKDFNFRQSQIKLPEQIMEETSSNLTYMPRSQEGQRNLSAIGDTLEYLKIPPFSPGIGNIGRIGKKGKTPRVKNVNSKQPTTSSETLFTRAKMYFDKSKEAQVDFNNNAITDLGNKMLNRLKEENISNLSSYEAAANTLIMKLQLKAKMGKSVNINELFEFRDLIDDIQVTTKPKSKFASGLLRDELDDFISYADEGVIAKSSKGNKLNIEAFKTGQKYYGKAKNTNILETLLLNAEMTAGTNFTQAQLVDAMKRQVQSLVKSEKKSRYFTKDQKKILQDFAKGGKVEVFLKGMSKLDPSSGGYVIGPTPATAALVGSYLGPEAGGLTYLGLGVAGKTSKAAREANMSTVINNMINKIQNRTVDVKPGFRQLDLQTDLGLLALPKEDLVKKEKEIQLRSLLDSQLRFPQGRK